MDRDITTDNRGAIASSYFTETMLMGHLNFKAIQN
jgi:hypothetical protein